MKPETTPITNQPMSLKSMDIDFYQDLHVQGDEKNNTSRSQSQCDCEASPHPHSHPHPQNHHSCHNSRLRRMFVPFILGLLVLGIGFALYTCLSGGLDWGTAELLKRQVNGQTGQESSFTKNKRTLSVHKLAAPNIKSQVYLIVIFVGLVIVVILAVCLSAWCCKGAPLFWSALGHGY